MHRLRRLFLHDRKLVALVFALALAMKLIVPAGFMPTFGDSGMMVSICTGAGPMTMAMLGVDHGKPGTDGQHGKTEAPCAFAGLSAPSLAAADPVLLAAAILFVMALGLRVVASMETPAVAYLRPPLRGPPPKA